MREGKNDQKGGGVEREERETVKNKTKKGPVGAEA